MSWTWALRVACELGAPSRSGWEAGKERSEFLGPKLTFSDLLSLQPSSQAEPLGTE